MTDKRWKPFPPNPRTVTIDKAAEVLAVSTTTIQQMMRDGQLHGIKSGVHGGSCARNWSLLCQRPENPVRARARKARSEGL